MSVACLTVIGLPYDSEIFQFYRGEALFSTFTGMCVGIER
jgi:hypothetical protein